ncbi:MAG: hypothetical protein ABIT01_05585 [Thermoanaerobaculia bacterium]
MVALLACLALVVGGWFLVGWLRARGTTPVVVTNPTPALHSEAAAEALLKPSADGGARRTPLGSFTTSAAGGRLDRAEIIVEASGGALPEGTQVVVSRIDAAPVAMRDSFPVARFGDFTPLSPILEVETGTATPKRAVAISFPVANGARFTWLAVVTWDPATSAWESFPARFDPASGRATAEVSRLGYLHLLGLDDGPAVAAR